MVDITISVTIIQGPTTWSATSDLTDYTDDLDPDFFTAFTYNTFSTPAVRYAFKGEYLQFTYSGGNSNLGVRQLRGPPSSIGKLEIVGVLAPDSSVAIDPSVAGSYWGGTLVKIPSGSNAETLYLDLPADSNKNDNPTWEGGVYAIEIRVVDKFESWTSTESMINYLGNPNNLADEDGSTVDLTQLCFGDSTITNFDVFPG